MPLCLRVMLLFLALAVVAAGDASAQRQTKENFNAWFSTSGDVTINPAWGVEWDASLRRSGPLAEWQQILARAAVRYSLAANARVAVGVGRSDAFPYGKLPIEHRRPEWRLYEHVTLTQSVGRVQLLHRYRAEQRWIGQVAANGSTEGLSDWIRVNRFRTLMRATIPLQGSELDVGEWYVASGSELFINWGSNVKDNVFDQLRLQALLGRRVSSVLSLEIGYLEQLSLKPTGRDLERNHTIVAAMSTYFRRAAGQVRPR